MNCFPTAAAVLALAVVAGCAATDSATATAAKPMTEEREYRTGSNIPVREDKKPMTQEEKDRRSAEAQRTIQQMQTTGAGNPRP